LPEQLGEFKAKGEHCIHRNTSYRLALSFTLVTRKAGKAPLVYQGDEKLNLLSVPTLDQAFLLSEATKTPG
jgi:hypothetical protein